MATEGEKDILTEADNSALYPSESLGDLKEERRNYKDEAAAEFYKAAGGPALARSHASMCRALNAQAERLVNFHSTPFTKQHMSTIKVTLEGIERVERLLERWHLLIYPNQAPSKDQRDVG